MAITGAITTTKRNKRTNRMKRAGGEWFRHLCREREQSG